MWAKWKLPVFLAGYVVISLLLVWIYLESCNAVVAPLHGNSASAQAQDEASPAQTTAKPDKPSGASSETSATEAASSAPDIEDVFPADLNRVTAAELELIPGIGAVKAAAIVSYRDAHDGFARLSQLTEVSGIGEKTLALLSEYLYVKGEQPETKPAVTTAPTTKPSATKPDLTTKKPVVTAETTTHKPVTSATTTPTPVRHKVCINTADAREISEALLLDRETARGIVDLRTKIGRFENTYELLYVDGITDAVFVEIRGFVTV
ncbi:MAG: helix-hairpin-helix domain-containing protein [Oscillospiraceae bacterium]